MRRLFVEPVTAHRAQVTRRLRGAAAPTFCSTWRLLRPLRLRSPHALSRGTTGKPNSSPLIVLRLASSARIVTRRTSVRYKVRRPAQNGQGPCRAHAVPNFSYPTTMRRFSFMWSREADVVHDRLLGGDRFLGDTLSSSRIAICNGLLRFANRLRLIPTCSEC
jgi:hypothetical protein